MKKTIFILSIISLLFACNKKEASIEKIKKQLKEKKEKLDVLEDEIFALEKQIEKLDTSNKDNRIAVKVEPISKSTFSNQIEIQGLVESNLDAQLTAEYGGRISRILVREGQRVSQGQILVRLDASQIYNQLAELENSIALAETTYNKQQQLWDKNIGSEMQYLQAKANYEGLLKSRETLKTQISKFTVKAPFSGTIENINAEIGEIASPGFPIMQLVNNNQLSIKASAPEKYIGNIKNGDKVSIYIPSLDKTITETIKSVGNYINPANRTFTFYTSLKNKTDLKSNMLAKIRLQEYAKENIIQVPTELVRNDGNNDYVFIATQDSIGRTVVHKKVIKILKSFIDKTIVESGLNEGDKLITAGYQSVIEGDPIKIVE